MRNKKIKQPGKQKKHIPAWQSFFMGFIVLDLIFVAAFLMPDFPGSLHVAADTETIAVKPVMSTILATGQIESENEATLHFQTGGKLTALPVKEGEPVANGQTVAQLDTYALQRQLTTALNTYRSTRDTFDQTQQGAAQDVLKNQQQALQKTGLSGSTEDTYISDLVKRLVDQNQASLDNSVINVELANYALQLSTLTAPFGGVVTHEDVTSSGVNITPQTSFVVADPTALVFRALVTDADIPFISVGQNATITLDGETGNRITGTISKIYPDKITLPSGESGYRVDIQSDTLSGTGKLQQKGSVLIENKYHTPVTLVPSWTILNGNQIWVMSGDKPVLKTVTVGDTQNNTTEILGGLTSNERVIVNPKAIAKQHYFVL